VLTALLIVSAGCSSRRYSEKVATTEGHAILKSLLTRDRNAVRVALWTLQQNGISVSQKIQFELPYAEVRPDIATVYERVRRFSEKKLATIDQSLSYHWQIDSPIWGSNDWP
jgi:hypothetical protein